MSSSPFYSDAVPFSRGLLDLDVQFFTGPTDPTSTVYDVYAITGPTTLGADIVPTFAFSSSDSGIASALLWICEIFGIDTTYASGAPIFSSSTFSGISLASLGMPASGTLGTWTLLDPGDPSCIGDTISAQVNASSSGSPASVPGLLPLLGLGAAFGFSLRLRRRVRLRSKISQSRSPGSNNPHGGPVARSSDGGPALVHSFFAQIRRSLELSDATGSEVGDGPGQP